MHQSARHKACAPKVYDVFRNHCYDNEPNKRWKNQPRASKNALLPTKQEQRVARSEVSSRLVEGAIVRIIHYRETLAQRL